MKDISTIKEHYSKIIREEHMNSVAACELDAIALDIIEHADSFDESSCILSFTPRHYSSVSHFEEDIFTPTNSIAIKFSGCSYQLIVQTYSSTKDGIDSRDIKLSSEVFNDKVAFTAISRNTLIDTHSLACYTEPHCDIFIRQNVDKNAQGYEGSQNEELKHAFFSDKDVLSVINDFKEKLNFVKELSNINTK